MSINNSIFHNLLVTRFLQNTVESNMGHIPKQDIIHTLIPGSQLISISISGSSSRWPLPLFFFFGLSSLRPPINSCRYLAMADCSSSSSLSEPEFCCLSASASSPSAAFGRPLYASAKETKKNTNIVHRR